MTDAEFLRYLAAKRTVDDRALNRVVWDALAREIPGRSAGPKILDIGCGIGTMLERILDWRLASRVSYTGVDASRVCIEHAREHLPRRVGDPGVTVELLEADFYDLPARLPGRRWDLVVAHAFIDIVEVSRALPVMTSLLVPGGLLLLSIAFDGVTALEPVVDPVLDRRIEDAYHGTMDTRLIEGRPSGDSRTGRHLLVNLTRAGVPIVEAGASDWVVFARDGAYTGDEAFFLRAIVETMAGAVRGHPAIAASELEGWRKARLAQIDRGELVYLAHQLDVLARVAQG